MDGVLFKASVKKVSTLVDGSLTILLETPEMGNDDAANLLSLRKVQGLAYISPKKRIDGAVMDTIDGTEIEMTGGKSPSKRLRDRLYVYWERFPSGFDSFEMFYMHELEAFGKTYLDKLEPR